MGELIPMVGFIAVAAIIIFIAGVRHKERMELINKGEYSAFSRLDVQSPPLPGRNALFWGLVIVGLGVAGIIYFIVLGIDDEDMFFFSSFHFLIFPSEHQEAGLLHPRGHQGGGYI